MHRMNRLVLVEYVSSRRFISEFSKQFTQFLDLSSIFSMIYSMLSVFVWL